MIYYDKISKQFYDSGEIPAMDNAFEITPEAHDFYNQNRDNYTIDLDRLNETITMENIIMAVDMESLRQYKLAEANAACQAAIYSGVDVGDKHFSLTEHDQTEILGLLAQVKEGTLPAVPYHADGELCKLWSVEDFMQIAQTAQAHVFYHRTYCNHLRVYIKRIEDKAELFGLEYGAELPEDLQANMAALLGDLNG